MNPRHTSIAALVAGLLFQLALAAGARAQECKLTKVASVALVVRPGGLLVPYRSMGSRRSVTAENAN